MNDLSTPLSGGDLNALMKELVKAWQPILEQIEQRVAAFIAAVHPIYQAIQQNYRDQGAIYGNTDDGMRRWLREIAEIERHKAKADRLIQHHEMLRDLAVKVRPNLSSD